MKIILIGFMGSGKSTWASELARKLSMKVIAMDDLVLKKSKRKDINQIFAQDGETRFRELEIETARDLQNKDNVVISTGGGVVMNEIILDYLRKNGVVVFLNASFEIIEKRLEGDASRPLFKNKKEACELYALRLPLYKKYADIIVETTDITGKDEKAIKKLIDILAKKYENFSPN